MLNGAGCNVRVPFVVLGDVESRGGGRRGIGGAVRVQVAVVFILKGQYVV